MIDSLTKTYNRPFFEEALKNEVLRCCRTANAVGVIVVDVDGFQQLNRTCGREFGDLVLQRVARSLWNVLRRSDVLARAGDDTFVLLIHQPTEQGLKQVAERIRSGIESEVFTFEDTRVPVTVSVGAAIALPRRYEEDLGSRVFAVAEEALHELKQNGRNQVHVRSLLEDRDKRISELLTSRLFSRWLVRRRVLDVASISKVLKQCPPRRVRIGELARERGDLDEQQVQLVLRELDHTGERFGEVAIRLGFFTEDHLIHLLAVQQEDPVELARMMVQIGMLSREEAAVRLKEYLEETAPDAVPSVASTV